MQPYSKSFARVFNTKLLKFSQKVAPLIFSFYTEKTLGENKNVLDLCCGTGQLAEYFLQHGYYVTGIDLSEHMLHYAKENTHQYTKNGQAKFLCADAADFILEDKFGLVVSTFDSLNHLQNENDLLNCFRCVYKVCEDFFIFDLKTRLGLKNWSRFEIEEDDDALILTSGIYCKDENKAWLRMFGFIHSHGGFYERFDEFGFGTVFDMRTVKNLLLKVGWKNVYFSKCADLKIDVSEPEFEDRVFVIATK